MNPLRGLPFQGIDPAFGFVKISRIGLTGLLGEPLQLQGPGATHRSNQQLQSATVPA
jgi:hypothetical protein